MSRFELLNFSRPDDLALKAAEDWLAHIESAARGGAPFCVALAGVF